MNKGGLSNTKLSDLNKEYAESLKEEDRKSRINVLSKVAS